MLALQAKEEKLPLCKRLEVKLHLYYCRCCSNFVKQNKIMDETLEHFIENVETNPPFIAPPEFKAKLKSQLH
jgi:hypothetical protein